MSFYQEPTGYEKTIISDLQGSWQNLREAIVRENEIIDCSKLLFHVDEAMSWESVRNLNHMKNTLILIQSMAQQINVSDEVMMWIQDVRDTLYEVLSEIKNDKIL